jgi:transcriptional regulator with XRE-family HTH domain
MRVQLKQARELAGLSQRELSRLIGQSETYVGQVESGEISSPTVRVATDIASTLGLSLDWLLTGLGRAPSKTHVRSSVDKRRAEIAATAA